MNPQLGAAVREKTAAKVIAGAANYLLHDAGEQILFVGKTNQVRPTVDHVVLTDMRLVGVLASQPARGPKVQAWWPEVRSYAVSDKWSSMNRLTLITHEGKEIHFGTLREADLPLIRTHIERLMSPMHADWVLRRLTELETARLAEQEHRAREWRRYQETSSPSPPPDPLSSPAPPPVQDIAVVPPSTSATMGHAPLPVQTPPRSADPDDELTDFTEALLDSVAENGARDIGPSSTAEAFDDSDDVDRSDGDAPLAVPPISERSFLAELTESRRKPRKWPYLLLLCEIAGIAMRGNGWIVMTAGLLVALMMAAVENQLARPRFHYGLPGEEESPFNDLVTVFIDAMDAQAAWLITGRQAVISPHERKANAGAGVKTTRLPASISFSRFRGIDTDVSAPTLIAGPWVVHFYPDRILLGRNGRFTEHRYEELHVEADVTRFVEESALPSDAVVVDYTWKYVNARGGPDRRYKDNRRLPIALYGELTLEIGDTRLVWMISVADLPGRLCTVLQGVGAR